MKFKIFYNCKTFSSATVAVISRRPRGSDSQNRNNRTSLQELSEDQYILSPHPYNAFSRGFQFVFSNRK